MGAYLVSVGADEWFGEEEDGWGEVASALNAELRQRGLPPYVDVPPETDFAAGSGQAVLCGWTVLVPIPLDEEIWLPIDSGYYESTMVAGAPQVLPLAEKLAAAIGLPAETPATCDNLDLSTWFCNRAKELVTTRTGPWSTDLDAAFYVALFLRAAQHSIRRGCPIVST
ncbi:hypothetical protein [Streptomyces sp. NBC_00273]|uniref:hypothetical protein n=1 Tax=Streptomyces sp. NBC_00273 TaxID=2903644 RepID=UPI002E294068|nr:hypothetical protein [Streptomyces sp. NBC_00273]